MGTLVLLSGGIDSTTALAHACNHDRRIEAVFVDYGQRHIVERTAAVAVAQHYQIELSTLDLRAVFTGAPSALTDHTTTLPHGHYTESSMAATVVPNRNAVMLSAAASIAATRQFDTVVTAVHAGDHAIYGDCRSDFINALSTATELACGVTIAAPFNIISKADIVALGHTLDAPYHLTWSCYEGGATHCGRCATCVERAEAFHLAHVPDPTVYTDPTFWKGIVA